MYSDWKQIAYDVKDGIIKQKKLVILYLIWSIICIYWGIWNFSGIYEYNQIGLSTADLLILLQHRWNFGIMIFPAALFIVMKCKQDGLNIQFVLRYGSRKRMLRRQVMESIVYAACMTMILLVMQTLLSMLKNGQLINWSGTDSLYYIKTGSVISENFAFVFLGISLMYFVKFMIALVILDILLWYPKYIFLLWILVVLLVGIENIEIPVFYQIFAIQYIFWQVPLKHIMLLLIGGLLVVLEYLVGIALTKKKDLYL